MLDIHSNVLEQFLTGDLLQPFPSLFTDSFAPINTVTGLNPVSEPLVPITPPLPAPYSKIFSADLTPSLDTNRTSQAIAPEKPDPLTGLQLSSANLATASTEFIRREGDRLVDGSGNPFTFQGIAFGNENWNGDSNPLDNDHSRVDFRRVKDLGMNSVRFYLNYQWFESDSTPYQYKASGFRWLNQNIAWAKENNISLILNMHVPQGGYQSRGEGDALWTNRDNQNRLIALWKTIANRYKNETTIAGYGLVNEPIPVGTKGAWQNLAQRLANNIRKVDPNHLLFVEGVIGIDQGETVDFSGTGGQKMIKIKDPNTVYEFHFYDPFEFTHQQFSWGYPGDGGRYPDETLIQNPEVLSWYTAAFDNPRLPSGNTPWQFFEGQKFTVSDPKIKVVLPALVAENIGLNGQVSFDDIVIKEYNPQGQLTRTFQEFDTNSLTGWSHWTSNGVGSAEVSTVGHNDAAALSIFGTTADSNLSQYREPILTRQGYSYQISGWMQGKNVSANAIAQLRLDFQTSNRPILFQNKQFLRSKMQPYISWGKRQQVPLYMGEFGAGRPTFENNRGGVRWVEDVIDIAQANRLSFNYHAYHEDAFGLYPGFGNTVDPSQVNLSLQNLFRQKL